MAIGTITYDDVSRREDLIDVITNVSPRETPLLSGLARTSASNTLHEYLTATFASATDNAQAESSAFTVVDQTQPTRANNNTQIFLDFVTVSGTEMSVDQAGMSDPLQYQLGKNMTEHAKDIEHGLMLGSRASGSSGVARRMNGVMAALTTNATARVSGSSLGETTFNDIINMVYESTDMVADEVYVGGTLKRDISGFTAGSTKYVEAEDKRLIRPVDVYESDFGVHKIFLHRDVGNGANAKELVAINSDYHKLAWLRPTKAERLTKDGDRERGQISSELTMEHLGEATGAKVTGFTS